MGIATANIALGGQWIATSITAHRAAAQLEQEKAKFDAQLALERQKFEYESLQDAFTAYWSGREARAVKMLHFYSELGLIQSDTGAHVQGFIEIWLDQRQISREAFNMLNADQLSKEVGEDGF